MVATELINATILEMEVENKANQANAGEEDLAADEDKTVVMPSATTAETKIIEAAAATQDVEGAEVTPTKGGIEEMPTEGDIEITPTRDDNKASEMSLGEVAS